MNPNLVESFQIIYTSAVNFWTLELGGERKVFDSKKSKESERMDRDTRRIILSKKDTQPDR